MFKRLIVLIILFFASIPVYSGVYEETAKDNQNIFLYLYTQECSYCVKFNPVYNNVAKKYSDKYKFLKVNAKTAEGYSLMKRFNAEFVPFVVLINTKTNEAANISPGCLLKLACTERVINDFFK